MPPTPSAPAMGAMPAAGASPAPAAVPGGAGGMGGMGDMATMMKAMMGGPPQKELYPSLMALPVLSAKQRLQLQQQAEARAKIGAAQQPTSGENINE